MSFTKNEAVIILKGEFKGELGFIQRATVENKYIVYIPSKVIEREYFEDELKKDNTL